MHLLRQLLMCLIRARVGHSFLSAARGELGFLEYRMFANNQSGAVGSRAGGSPASIQHESNIHHTFTHRCSSVAAVMCADGDGGGLPDHGCGSA